MSKYGIDFVLECLVLLWIHHLHALDQSPLTFSIPIKIAQGAILLWTLQRIFDNEHSRRILQWTFVVEGIFLIIFSDFAQPFKTEEFIQLFCKSYMRMKWFIIITTLIYTKLIRKQKVFEEELANSLKILNIQTFLSTRLPWWPGNRNS